jgi:hypothetical protein
MPTTIREYFGELYEPCETKDFLEGDIVVCKDWFNFNQTPPKSGYFIVRNDRENERIHGYSITYTEYTHNWSYNDFFRTDWYRKITEVPYDPTQMGDTDEDI